MKPTVPETGIIIRLEEDNAVIGLKGGKSCKGCGIGKISLCRAGDTFIDRVTVLIQKTEGT